MDVKKLKGFVLKRIKVKKLLAFNIQLSTVTTGSIRFTEVVRMKSQLSNTGNEIQCSAFQKDKSSQHSLTSQTSALDY